MRNALVIGFAGLLAGCGAGEPAGGGATAPGDSRGQEERAAQGPPWFEEVAASSGLAFTYRSGHADRHYMPEIMGGGAALLDMDDDGDLDAYLVQGGSVVDAPDAAVANRLFRNDGAGRFSDVSAGSGAEDPRYGMGVACGDADGDGDTDLYVTNVGRNTLLLNDGDGRFHDATDAYAAGDPGWGASAGFFDYDRDGRLDLFVTNYLDWSVETELPCMDSLGRPDYCSPKNYKTPARDVLYRNAEGTAFRDRSRASGVGALPGTGLGLGCADFDADGWLDVFVANDGMPDRLWRNGGDGTFADVAPVWGCATDVNGIEKAGMGVALGDVDMDGDVDVLVCNLAGETDSFYLNQGDYFGDQTARAGLAASSRPFTRFGMALVDLDSDGFLDIYQANGRVQRAGHDVVGDPYAEENLLLRGTGAGTFEEVLPRGGTTRPLVATSRGAAFGDVDGDGGIDVLVVNRDGPAHLLRNRASAGKHWILFRVRERSGADALGASLEIDVAGKTVLRDVRAAYSYLTSNDPRVHVGLGSATEVQGVRVRWVDGAIERFGPFEADRVHELRRGTGTAEDR